MKTLMWLLSLYAVALIPLSAAAGRSFRGGDEDDGLKRHLQTNCIWPGVACTTDVVHVEFRGAILGTTIPTEIGFLTNLGEFSY